ncbi:DUF4330 family protein [Halorubrum sp. JWXQ-INN 858]|uniref:DUF4330 domain-containing protein n=1 Tax=Halorubrum sp. JWXQ-INN 858 TaxID=2690782 RepID=UPI001356A226|nr:DUF4330 domain-containing protein [Halorubrum sp. JWXQ-INN 858]MWV65243.1 DUF4330 family protein [Halorubrum sp. JWXQ-INN 858]
MELIDDDGDLFGVVNVVDVLVVLVVLAVGVAGVALVFAGDPDPEPDAPDIETTYATLDLGPQPAYVADAVREGDTYEPDADSTLTVTDVHVTPHGGDVGVTLRVELAGELDDDAVRYANAPPRLGRTLDLETDRYVVDGRIRAVGDDAALDRDERTVVLRDTLDAETAESVTPGDEVRLAGRTVATIDDVATFATRDADRSRLYVEAVLDAHREDDRTRFGGVPLRRGQSVSLPAADYTLDAEIERVGGDFRLGETATRTVTLRMDEVRQDTADAVEPGMTEGPVDDPVAEVTAVETEPSIIIATGDDGTVNVVDHPRERDVTITADLQVRETPTGVRFKGDSLRTGSTVVLDLGTVTVEAEVVRVDR